MQTRAREVAGRQELRSYVDGAAAGQPFGVAGRQLQQTFHRQLGAAPGGPQALLAAGRVALEHLQPLGHEEVEEIEEIATRFRELVAPGAVERQPLERR